MSFRMEKKDQPKSPMRHPHHQRLVRHHHGDHHPKRSSTMKTKYFSFIASISNSIHKCQRRLVEFFSKLAGTRRHQAGFVVLEHEETCSFEADVGPRLKRDSETNYVLPGVLVLKDNHRLLPPLVSGKKRTIVLDLDETLVHSSPELAPSMYDFMIEPNIHGLRMKVYVLKRPGVDKFLETISKKYEVVVFTAGLEPYASLLLDVLDPKGLISHRLYRDSCKQLMGGRFVKDLSKIGRDLRKLVIVDDNPKSYAFQPANAIPIKRFENDIEDRELEKLTGFFETHCDGFDDMRDAVKQCFGFATLRQPRSLLQASSVII